MIGGGFPVARMPAAAMDRAAPAGKVYQAGTLRANPVGSGAGLAALTKMAGSDGWAQLECRADRFCAALASGFADLVNPLNIVRQGSIFWMHLRAAGVVRRPDAIPAGNAEWFSRLFHAAIDRGVYLPPSSYEVGFLSMAHDAPTLHRAATALIEAAHEADAP